MKVASQLAGLHDRSQADVLLDAMRKKVVEQMDLQAEDSSEVRDQW